MAESKNKDVQAIKGEDKDTEAIKTAERLAEAEGTPAAKTEKSPKAEKTETAEKPEKTPETQAEEAEDVPKDPKEAGKAFSSMRRRLKDQEAEIEKLRVLKEAESPASPFMGQPGGVESQPQVNLGVTPNIDKFYDPTTGEFDAGGFQQHVTSEARQAASQQIDEFRQTQEAVGAYPELDPNSKNHDKEFYQAVRGRLLDSMLRPNEYGGKVLSYKEAADRVSGLNQKARKQVESEGAEKAMEEVAAKEAVGLEATSSSGRAAQAESVSETERLSEETRKGGKEGSAAIAERLNKLGQ